VAGRSAPRGSVDGELADLLPRVSRELHRRIWPEIRASGITNAQFWILKWISLNGSMTVTELARFLDLTAATVTQFVNELESQGLVERARSVKDRRVVAVRASAKGERVLGSAQKLAAKATAKFTKPLPVADKAAAARVLRALARSLEEESPSMSTRTQR
jgi:DNA-binding MarR family transcriptional regulator